MTAVMPRACPMCKTDISEMPEFYSTCNGCFGEYAEKNLRACIDCAKRRIKNDEPTWKTRCGTCYKAGSQQPFRVCTTCTKPTIHPLSASWRKVCTDCYKLSKLPTE